MKRIVPAAAVLAFLATLGVGGIATTAVNAQDRCWTENTDYDGDGDDWNCLGGICSAGWCCLICPKEEIQ